MINWIVNGWKKLLVYVGILALTFTLGAYTGYDYRKGMEAKQVVTQLVEDVEHKEKNQEIADDVGAKQEAVKEKTKIVYKTIEKEVTRYEKTDPDADSPIGPEWVCLFNKSARGEPVAEAECKSGDAVPGSAANPGRPQEGDQGAGPQRGNRK